MTVKAKTTTGKKYPKTIGGGKTAQYTTGKRANFQTGKRTKTAAPKSTTGKSYPSTELG